MVSLPKAGLDCSKINDNHSQDRITMYRGELKPYQMCGYHAERLTHEQWKLLREGESDDD